MRETARFDGTSTDVMRALMVLSDMEWSVAQPAMKYKILKSTARWVQVVIKKLL